MINGWTCPYINFSNFSPKDHHIEKKATYSNKSDKKEGERKSATNPVAFDINYLTNQASISIDQLYNRTSEEEKREGMKKKGLLRFSEVDYGLKFFGIKFPSALFWLTGSRESMEIYDSESEIRT